MRFDFTPLFRSTVGFDRLFDTLDQISQHEAGQSYPPYNIERTGENEYRVTVAVAGFAEKDLNVEVRDGVLAVTGKREEAEKAEKPAYIHRGIAGRAFEHRFQLADHVEVRGAAIYGRKELDDSVRAAAALAVGLAYQTDSKFDLARTWLTRAASLNGANQQYLTVLNSAHPPQ